MQISKTLKINSLSLLKGWRVLKPRVTKFHTVVPNIWGSSIWKLLRTTLFRLEFWNKLWAFRKLLGCCKTVRRLVLSCHTMDWTRMGQGAGIFENVVVHSEEMQILNSPKHQRIPWTAILSWNTHTSSVTKFHKSCRRPRNVLHQCA
jgi:hypothetical protein